MYQVVCATSCRLYAGPTRQHELDHARCGIRLPCKTWIMQVGIDHLSDEVWKFWLDLRTKRKENSSTYWSQRGARSASRKTSSLAQKRAVRVVSVAYYEYILFKFVLPPFRERRIPSWRRLHYIWLPSAPYCAPRCQLLIQKLFVCTRACLGQLLVVHYWLPWLPIQELAGWD